MIEVPETRYVKSGDVNIAYQVVGKGPFDLIHVPPFVSNLELQWEDPAERRYFERLASFSRLIMSTNEAPACPIGWPWRRLRNGWTIFAP